MTEVSIIIPTYNGAGILSACLDSIVSQKTDRKYEIIVVNDGSTDNTSEIVKKYNSVTLITQANAGPASARNHGAEKAVGDILLFIDDDCIAEPDWLDAMIKPFEDPKTSGAKGAYLTNQKEWIAKFVQIEYEEKYDELSRHKYIDFIDTYSAAFRRQIFIDERGYDTNFSTASVEDQEFSFRLANMGYKMVFVPRAKVFHTHVTTINSYIRKKFKIGYWKVLALNKNPNKVFGDSHTPLTLKMQILLTTTLFLSFLFILTPLGTIPLLILITTFLITAIPLTVRCFFRDPIIGILAPLFILLRAIGLTVGLAKGFIFFIGMDKKNP
ncbi:MAG: glycosyltransferase [Desulfobacteraceae bacterium]|nr:glycosyltransferase [Desulfobacteraceae bacterium]